MIKFVQRKAKNYSRHNILKAILKNMPVSNELFLLLPFSKKKFFGLWLARKVFINDFFISDFDTYYNDRKKGAKYSLSAIYKFILDWFNFRYSRYILSDTQTHFEHWQNLFGRFKGRHLVFPVLADDRIYYPEAAPARNQIPRLLFYGYFIPLHGIDVILRALKICEDRGIAFCCDLVGEGQTLDDMLDLARELQLKQVRFNQAFVSEEELAARIRGSDLVLGIFGESEKAHSVVPNKVYQALACRAAVITQESRAVREFFSEKDLCLVDRDPVKLADAIEFLLNNPEARSQLAEQGHLSYRTIYDRSVESLLSFVREIDESR